MKNRRSFSKIAFLGVFVLAFSCAGSPKPSSPADSMGRPDGEKRPGEIDWPEADRRSDGTQPEMVFIPREFPSLEIMPGVGFITGDRRDRAASLTEKEKADLSDSFRAAYADGLLQEAPLAGVLGGDFVHNWPANNPLGWVQNWSTAIPEENSWRSPSLVLAIRGFMAETDDRVFIVQGKMLDQYGKNDGINRANGNTGYGSPLGNQFLYEGKVAQRFESGLITIDREG